MGREIDFLYLFAFGVIYYIFLPSLVHEFELFLSFPGIKIWYDTFNKGTQVYLPVIYIFFGAILCMLYFNFILNKIRVKTISLPIISNASLSFCFILIAMLSFYFWFNARGMLFEGYSVAYSSDVMGKMATLNLICNFFALYGFQKNAKHFTNKLFLLLLIINSIFLLGMGGRMYVLSALITFFIYFLNKNSFDRVKFIFVIVITMTFMIFIGMFRLGSTDLSLAGYLFVAEPVFTSYSSISFLSQNEIPLLATGELAFKSLIGFLPSFLFENKVEYIVTPLDLGYKFSNPLGATSVIVSSFISFGSAGAIVFFILMYTGFFCLRCLSKRDIFFRTIYICSLSVIPFLFFRESFSISFRVLWFVNLIIPIFIITMDVMIKKSLLCQVKSN
ncbi:oligosaccharide repeat unit polymerase [Paraglaciecola sp.]|nr:oligosaccharide repeat unit polymerase [Paraglaciecola sp.]